MMLALVVAAVAGLGTFSWMTVRGLVWSGRL
jgi:hypothetical protein